jgi:hypothetical protein
LKELSRLQCERVKDFMVNEMEADANYIRVFANGAENAFRSDSGTSAANAEAQKANRRVDIVFRN